jgi:hypothetical protein
MLTRAPTASRNRPDIGIAIVVGIEEGDSSSKEIARP